jgi:multiple sugar transport system substrate-binding protein
VAAAKPASAGAPAKVWFTAVLDEGMDVIMAAMIERFNKEHPNVAVKFEEWPWDGYPEKLITTVAGGAAPDMTFVHPSWVTLFAEQKVIMPLDPFVQSASEFQIEDFFPDVAAYFVYKGKRYCLPVSSWPTVTYFNKTLFDKLGVPHPTEFMKGFESATDGWTWEKTRELAIRLTQGEGVNRTFGLSQGYGAVPSSLSHLSQIIYSYGGEVWSEDLKKTRLSEPPAVEAIRFQAELISKHHVAPLPAETQSVPGGVNSGRFAMWLWNRSEVPGFKKAPFEIGMAPFPRGPKGRVLRDGPTGEGISSASKVQDATWEFYQWYAGPRPGVPGGQEYQFQSQYSIPTRKSLAKDPLFVKNLLPWETQQVYEDAATRVRPLPLVGRFAEIDKVYKEQWDKAVHGRATVEDALKEFTAKADPMLG